MPLLSSINIFSQFFLIEECLNIQTAISNIITTLLIINVDVGLTHALALQTVQFCTNKNLDTNSYPR